MRPKVILSVIVCLALLLSFGAVANADQLLFPWIVKGSGVSTLVSVVNTAPGDKTQYGSNELHYQYHYKKTVKTDGTIDNGLTGLCEPGSFTRPTSQNDIVTFDAAGNINGGKALFSDKTSADPDQPAYGGDTFALTASGDRRAYLIVDNDMISGAEDGTLYGEALVIDLGSGAAWGYIAYNASGDSNAQNQNSAAFFSDGLDLTGEVIGQKEWAPVVVMPPALTALTTKIYITPTGANFDMRTSNANTIVQLVTLNKNNVTYSDALGAFGGIYDNKENIIDGAKKVNVVCTGADVLSAFLDTQTLDGLKNTGGQGWAYIRSTDGNIVDPLSPNGPPYNKLTGKSGVNQSMIGVLTLTIAPGITIADTPAPGTWNDFKWLKNSATVIDLNSDCWNAFANSGQKRGCLGINYIHPVE